MGPWVSLVFEAHLRDFGLRGTDCLICSLIHISYYSLLLVVPFMGGFGPLSDKEETQPMTHILVQPNIL